MEENAVVQACERNWDKWKSDCSGFLKAVAADLGITIVGQANDIVGTMGHLPWVQLGTDADKAVTYASQRYLVVAGNKWTPNGHLAIIVPGPSKPYPKGYWGALGGVGRKDTTINYSWPKEQRPTVKFFALQLPGPQA